MRLPSWHIHISERESDGSWEDCTWDAGLEWYRLTQDKSKPATHTEAQALRAASGEPATGGSNIADFKRGVLRRYGKTMPATLGTFNALWSALPVGSAALVQGSMRAFGPTHRLSRWQTGFDGGHAVMVIRLDSEPRVWWCDPLAPKGTYEGQWVTKDELMRYVTQFAGQHLAAKVLPEPPPPPIPTPTGDDMPALTTYTPGHIATVKALSNVRNSPKIVASSLLRSIKVAETWKVIGTVKGDVDPATGSDVWYCRWNAGRFEYTAKENVTKIEDPLGTFNIKLAAAEAARVEALATTTTAKMALAEANTKITQAKEALA